MGHENGKGNGKTSPVVSLISGGVAGGVEAATTYPIEFAKTRAQLRGSLIPTPLASVSSGTLAATLPTPSSKPKVSQNPFSIIAVLYRTEGLRAMYKGCGIMIVGSVGKDAARFLSFDTVKNAFSTVGSDGSLHLSPMGSMGAGMTAGVVASIFAVTPSERIKTALIDDARSARHFKSTTMAIKSILREDGFVGLYRGFQGTTLKQAGGTSFRMGTYDILKDFESSKGISQGPITNFGNGAIAGVVTTLATQPFDTIKTRSQAAVRTTMLEAVRNIYSDGGVKAFWSGTSLRLARTVLSGGILFTTAEAVRRVVEPLWNGGI